MPNGGNADKAKPQLHIPQDNGGGGCESLRPFAFEEQPLITEAVARVAEALEVLLSRGIAEAVNKFNQKAEKIASD